MSITLTFYEHYKILLLYNTTNYMYIIYEFWWNAFDFTSKIMYKYLKGKKKKRTILLIKNIFHAESL